MCPLAGEVFPTARALGCGLAGIREIAGCGRRAVGGSGRRFHSSGVSPARLVRLPAWPEDRRRRVGPHGGEVMGGFRSAIVYTLAIAMYVGFRILRKFHKVRNPRMVYDEIPEKLGPVGAARTASGRTPAPDLPNGAGCSLRTTEKRGRRGELLGKRKDENPSRPRMASQPPVGGHATGPPAITRRGARNIWAERGWRLLRDHGVRRREQVCFCWRRRR